MLVILVLENPRASLRGYCRRFLLEPHANVFVGQATRPLLEDLASRIERSGIIAVLIASTRKADNGCRIKLFGDPHRKVVDLEGLQIVTRESNS